MPLTHLPNLSLQKDIVPAELKIAKTIPVSKDDYPAIFNHYQPISIAVIAKVLEKPFIKDDFIYTSMWV